jgi:hypothetical protein
VGLSVFGDRLLLHAFIENFAWLDAPLDDTIDGVAVGKFLFPKKTAMQQLKRSFSSVFKKRGKTSKPVAVCA